MVTVDDATYVKMKDTLYGGDAGAASKAKAKIESSYTQQQYDNLVSKLGNMGTTQQPTAPKPSNMDAGSSTIQQTTTPSRNMQTETPTRQQETVGSTVSNIQQQGELKPLSQDYYNQTGDDAQSKIISNLNNYRQTNPEYFRDYESFKKNFSYDARNDEQKQTLDSWYGGYQKGMELAGIPVTDLYTQYKDGQVSMNELENLRIYDPTKYAELQNQINKGNIIAAYDDDKGQDTAGKSIQDMAYDMAVQTFTKFMNGDGASEATQFFRDYESKMESPEMLALSDQCTEVQEQMENIQSDLDSIKKQVEAEYEGTGATRSKINAIIADRSYDLQLQLRTLNSEYNKYATQYNNRMQQYQNEFSMQLQEYQLNQQARSQQMQELGFAMDLMNFETNEQKQQREWDYWVKQQEYTNGNINSKDYDTRYKAALKSVQNLLSQYEGIPMQRSAEQMAQDILKAIDGGSDLGAELTKINQQIQGKPEYKMLYNQTYRPASAASGMDIQTFKIGDTEYTLFNGEMMTSDEFNSRFGGRGGVNMKPYDAVSESAFSLSALDPNAKNLGGFLLDSKNANGKKGGQCAKFVNDYLQKIGVGRYFGNEDIKTRQQWANSNTPKVGTIAIFDYGVTSSDGVNHGHVAIVTQVNKDGSFVVKESNYPSGEKIGTRTVNPNSPSLKGFFDPSQGARSVNVSEAVTDNSNVVKNQHLSQKFEQDVDWNKNGYIDSLSRDYESYLDKGKDAITDGQWKSLKEDYGIDEKDFRLMAQNYAKTALKQKGVEQASRALESATKLYDLITNSTTLWVSDNPQGGLLDWGLSYILPSSDAGEARNEFNTLLSRLQLNELLNAKSNGASFGAMSQSEWDILGNASTNLKWDSSSSTFKKNLEEIIKSLNDSIIEGGGNLPKNFQGSNAQKIISNKQSSNKPTTTQNTTTGNKNNTQSTDFYQTYANTAPSNNQTYYVDGYQVQR